MINTFEEMLTGGHPNSLGKTVEVVDIVLNDKSKLEDLYQCYFSEDEVVRLRVSNAFKRVCKEQPDWVYAYMDKFIDTISKINQPSTQWTFAQLTMSLDKKLTDAQRSNAITVMKSNLENSDDWIVANFTMEALSGYAKDDDQLKIWLLPRLKKFSVDKRKSVAKRAKKYSDELSAE